MECTPNKIKFLKQFGTELKLFNHLPTYFKENETIGKLFLQKFVYPS